MSRLDEAMPGFKVAVIEPWGWSSVRIKQAEVSRCGKNFLEVGGLKFTRSGSQYGSTGFHRSTRIEPWSDEKHPSLIAEAERARRLEAVRSKLANFRWRDLDIETAEAVLALLPKESA